MHKCLGSGQGQQSTLRCGDRHVNLKFVPNGTIVPFLWHRKLVGEYHSLPWDVYDRATKSVVRRTVCLRGINRRRLDYLFGGDSLFPIYPCSQLLNGIQMNQVYPLNSVYTCSELLALFHCFLPTGNCLCIQRRRCVPKPTTDFHRQVDNG
jgi:hypothetical protein